MFESITGKLQDIFRKLGSKGRLTEKNIQDGLREVRMALLEADVNYKVVKDFIDKVTQRAIGQEVIRSVTPAQQIIKVVYDELVALMGAEDSTVKMSPKPPTVIMMAGLQGGGKTTTCAKLAAYLIKKGNKPMLVAADIKRPAAIEQLKVLAQQLNVPVHHEVGGRTPMICRRAVESAEKNNCNVVILDTAGRLHIDAEMMAEVRDVAATVKPHQIYLVCDSMTGQDAVNSAKEFNAQLSLDGVILTKLDGDARGGAAMSVRAVTGKPIKFVGVGEKLEQFEEFHPDRMASRILGMGDVVSLVEKAQETIDQKTAEELQEKILKQEMNLQDFLEQFQRLKKSPALAAPCRRYPRTR
jgi:signal recognition particle subunit SRP54